MDKELIALDNQEYDIAYSTAKIDFREYQSLKSKVEQINDEFSHYEVTPYNMKSAKATKAQLNKLKKALNDRKISIVNTIDQPVNQFKEQIKGLTDSISQTSTRIGDQIKAYEDHAKQQKAMALRCDIEKRCQEAGGDPEQIVENPKWFNKTASYAVFETEVQAQIDSLVKDKEQLAESIKVVTARAKELCLPYQHWTELLENTSLSSVLSQMNDYAADIKAEAERNEKARKAEQAQIVNMNGKAVNKETGEVTGEFRTITLTSDKSEWKLTGTNKQFKTMWANIKSAGIKCECIATNRRDA
ncbi:DUF1351 domain-containing protein [Lactobacillus sp. ESL0236]|uniref:DUF1351 domain-containing protein n=1 Tax=unclassified Lactobacillus TaxID=2620435 RepID=UPI000EFBCB9E|nr:MULTISPECIES: DUF1351 domain-containing protein [unclassified Lactobacillus]RMC38145.1 DUF1351 domain-containing protein [Lactobacillus sp. ESL0237]RMC42446.1 DUF1351 domain-containing protein [Lactobacillus sp. ESL0234]RMC42611.1 DUF1351 domain-containing protein [Lactobacillus sp. ESL0236]